MMESHERGKQRGSGETKREEVNGFVTQTLIVGAACRKHSL